MKKYFLYPFIIMSVIVITSTPSLADKKKKSPSSIAEAPKKDGKKSIKETVKSCAAFEGLFTIYQDTTNGTAYLKVNKEQLNKEYIYFNYAENGVLAAGYFKGNFRDNEVFSIRKYYDKIEFIEENTGFYFDPQNPLSNASSANINKPVLASLKIVAEEDNAYLIKADELFLIESLSQIKPSPNPNVKPGTTFSLGSLSKEKTKYNSIKNYPKNTDVIVEYVYDNPAPNNFGGADVTDARSVTIKIQHTLIEMPQNDFKPRFDDPRIGYFMQEVQDMTSTSATPYRDMINRWNLVKKDKNAAISEPVEPITWWIENTTPVEFRETIRAAALSWNEAFEKAGFKNAIRCEIQPDDANWDAGDIRYNVLRWTSSPKPPFGGYGPSFVNPRTGEILGADIMLEYVFFTNRLAQEKLFDAAALNLAAPETENLAINHNCDIGNYFHQATQFGQSALNILSASEIEKREYLKESLYYLVLHELGHTFGLNHNMKSSQLWSPEEINNKEKTSKIGLTGSVMDYPAANVALDKSKQGQYFTMKPGPYDLWAIEFGYTTSLDDAKAEEEHVKKLLARSTEPQLTFGNDADDMRAPGKAIDPRVNINDLTNNAISYSIDRIKLTSELMKKLKTKYIEEDKSYHELRNAYLILSGEFNNAANVISRYIGGVYVDRSFPEQKSTTAPLTPVSYADQKRAMKALNDYVFTPTVFEVPIDLYNYLEPQRRGFNGGNEDPKVHERILAIQKGVLSQLLHSNVLKRITNSQLYGNQYSVGEFMKDLTDGIFSADAGSNVNTIRQNLQLEYVNNLISIIKNDEYDYRAQSSALYNLKQIKTMMNSAGGNVDTKAHREHIIFAVNKAMEK